ncbi:MAG TPA: HD domain-containing phosphohydrolase [Methylomirabilota bacterium]|nr:HD domain-containing phosphohydrolase [Methylomirabilota bacterium]
MRPPIVRLALWRRLAVRLAAAFVLLAAVGILASGFVQYRAQDAELRRSLGALLLNIARTGGLLIDGDLHARLGYDAAAYAAIRDRLLLIQDANGLDESLYTLTDVQGDRARLGVIGNGLGTVGSDYHLQPSIQGVVRRALVEGTPGFTDVYTGPDGAWISAFAPIRDGSQTIIAVLAVDYRANTYLAARDAVRRRLYWSTLVGAGLALIASVVLARHITRPLAALQALAHGVVEGDLMPRRAVRARDEIGLLANVLHLMVDRLRVSQKSVVDVLIRALEARDGRAGSLDRMAAASRELARGLGLSPAQQEALELGARLHDIGEVQTPEAVLGHPGPLSAAERAVVERHPAAGVEILETVPLLTPALDIVGSHHERWDGGGYPQGLRGEEIPLAARIFAVVDTLDALTHDRPYRRAWEMPEALALVAAEAGKQFDPRVAAAAQAIPAARWAELLLGRTEPA